MNTSINQNAKLLFLSAAICKNRTVDQVSALLTTFTADMEDGTINMSALNSSFSSVDTAVVTANIQTMYGSCPDIASTKAQVLTKLGLVDTTVKIITVQPVQIADWYISNRTSLKGFIGNTIVDLNIQYVQQYLGVTETLNAGITEFFSIGSGVSKILYFTITLPDSVIKSYSQTMAGTLTEISSLPSKPAPVAIEPFNNGEFSLIWNNEAHTQQVVTALIGGTDTGSSLLYTYYVTDHFISEGVDLGRGIFMNWSGGSSNWISSSTYLLYVNNIGNGRMW